MDKRIEGSFVGIKKGGGREFLVFLYPPGVLFCFSWPLLVLCISIEDLLICSVVYFTIMDLENVSV